MYAVWRERGLPKIREQRQCDQARAIRKDEWFTSIELDEIRRRRNRGAGCRAHRYRIRTEYELVDEINEDVNIRL